MSMKKCRGRAGGFCQVVPLAICNWLAKSQGYDECVAHWRLCHKVKVVKDAFVA